MALPEFALPDKLTQDAILEALFEVRFESTGSLPEVISGRLLNSGQWSSFEAIRLPEYEIPPRLREIDPNLRYRPTHVLKSPNGSSVRIGGHVLSCHVARPYPGWAGFRPMLAGACSALWEAAPDAVVSRLGLRYVNSLEQDRHGIDSFGDLNVTAKIAEERVCDDINVNLYDRDPDGMQSISRVATKRFVSGFPDSVSLVIDIDVFQEFTERPQLAPKQIEAWISEAHVNEKRHFFRLLRPQDVNRLSEVKNGSNVLQ